MKTTLPWDSFLDLVHGGVQLARPNEGGAEALAGVAVGENVAGEIQFLNEYSDYRARVDAHDTRVQRAAIIEHTARYSFDGATWKDAFHARLDPTPTPSEYLRGGGTARAAVGGALAGGGIALGALGAAEALSHDGVLPAAVGEMVAPINGAAGAVLGPFDAGGGAVHRAVADATGSQTVGLLGGAGASTLAYGAAGALAGVPGMVGLATGSALAHGLDYVGTKSDFATTSRDAISEVSALGLDTSPGTFGRDLALEFRAGTSGLTTNPVETSDALSTFRQLHESQTASGADLTLHGNGYEARDAAARERVLDLQGIALQAARDPSIESGAAFFPDGTSGTWTRGGTGGTGDGGSSTAPEGATTPEWKASDASAETGLATTELALADGTETDAAGVTAAESTA